MNPSRMMKDLGLDQYVGALEGMGINEDLLPYVTARDLSSAGIAQEHHQVILAAIQAHKVAPVAPAPPPPTPTPAPRAPQPRSRVMDAPAPRPVIDTNPFEAPVELSSTFSSYGSDDLWEDLPLASPGSRFVAQMIDGFAAFAAMIPGMLIMCAGMDSDGLAILGMLLVAAGGLGVGIYNWYLTATEGKTIGKRSQGVKIVKLDGSPVDFVSGVVMRSWVIGFIQGLANLFYLGFIVFLVDSLMIFSADHRCLHDHIAGTKVVIG